MRDDLQATLLDLLAIPSPTGMTTTIADHISGLIEGMGLVVVRHACGAVEAILPGTTDHPALAFVSHFDTLGAQVKALKQNGRAELVPIGTWSSRFAEGAQATLFTDKRTLRGTILPLKASGHTFNEDVDSQPVTWSQVELRIDVDSASFSDLVELGVHVGDWIAIDPQPEFSENGYLVSRHLDNKAGVAVMLHALATLVRSSSPRTRTTRWLFTAAEEVGLGAAGLIHPNVNELIAIDNGTTAPGQNSRETGVTIAMADQTGPFDRQLTHRLIDLCKSKGIDHQRDVFRYYRSDAATARAAGANVRTALITFGVDASHGYERIHANALDQLQALLVSIALAPAPIDASNDPKIKGP